MRVPFSHINGIPFSIKLLETLPIELTETYNNIDSQFLTTLRVGPGKSNYSLSQQYKNLKRLFEICLVGKFCQDITGHDNTFDWSESCWRGAEPRR